MRNLLPAAAKQSRSLVVAVVLGTALTAGTGRAQGTTTTKQSRPAESEEPVTETIVAISRYCQVCWRNAKVPFDRWPDCTQQVFARLLERVGVARWHLMFQDETEDRREFIRAIDAVKKQSLRTKSYADLCQETPDPRQTNFGQTDEAWDAIHTVAGEVLSVRQQRIVELSAGGWAVPEIAKELGTTPERVSDEKYKAIRKLREKLCIDG